MVILTAEQLAKSYGDRLLFQDVSFGLHDTDRVGLIGANGSGKSTLLRILLGHEEPDSGRVATSREAHIEQLSQRPELDESLSALGAALKDGPEAFDILYRYHDACSRLSEDHASEPASKEVERLTQEMERVQGWSLESEAQAVLSSLGIVDLDQRVSTMSGGQQKRVAIARALLRPSDLLVLDEPTNHLDVQTVEWLESYLSQRAGALLLITHDRYFLDRVANTIFEIAEQTLFRHDGNYTYFLESREARRETQHKREQKRAQLAKTELAWLRRGPQARTTKAKARIERAHALIDADHTPEAERLVAIETSHARLGKKILELKEVTKSYQGRAIVRDFSYTFSRNERLGLVGPNGSGKSTLLDLITSRVQPDSGLIEVGETIVFGYYDQQSIELDESMRVHDYIVEHASNHIETADGSLSASQMLERFLFSRQRQWDPISKLSGGERRRLYLLKVLMGQPNVLLLDEPTNDLDVETLTVLEDYLDHFNGVVIAVSHDRYFLDRVVDHVLVFEGDGELVEFPGDYTLWLEHTKRQERERREAQSAATPSDLAPSTGEGASQERVTRGAKKLSYKEQREYDGLMPRIEALEARLAEAASQMSARHDDYEALERLTRQSAELELELELAMDRWGELEERVEALKG